MRATLDSATWFSLVYKGFTIIGWNLLTTLIPVNVIHILYGEGIQPLLSRRQGSNKTEWKRNDYLICFFTYAIRCNESAVTWFFTSDILFTTWMRPVCSVMYQMTNPFGGVPKCFDYWKGLANLTLFLQHKTTNYGMFCANSLLYLRNYQAIPSSMEFLNRWKIYSNSFGVLMNNNWLSHTNLGVFLITVGSLSLPVVHNWVCNLLEHLFMSTNKDLIIFSAASWIDHPLGVTEPQSQYSKLSTLDDSYQDLGTSCTKRSFD